MSCFQSLVGNKFMTNALTEIGKAKDHILKEYPILSDEHTHTFDANQNQQAYYHVGNTFGFFQELYNVDVSSRNLYYLQYDRFLMIAGRSKRLIDSAIRAGMNVNGDVPIYRTKHTIRKVRIHTVLFNTNFTVPPASLN